LVGVRPVGFPEVSKPLNTRWNFEPRAWKPILLFRSHVTKFLRLEGRRHLCPSHVRAAQCGTPRNLRSKHGWEPEGDDLEMAAAAKTSTFHALLILLPATALWIWRLAPDGPFLQFEIPACIQGLTASARALQTGESTIGIQSHTLWFRVFSARATTKWSLQGEKERRTPNAVETLSRGLLTWRCGSFGLAVIPQLVAVLAKMNKRAPAAPCLSAASRSAIPSFDGNFISATLNVRSLSLPDQTRVVARRHLDRLLVSLHRAVVSRLSRT
jgi:hypothetical protein